MAYATRSRRQRSEWMPSPNLPAGFDFTDPDIYAERLPIAELAEMRKVAPIWWNEQPEGIGGFGDGGYWVVTEVSRRSDVFSSQEKTALPRYAEGASRDQIDASRGIVLLNMDAPHHTHLRKIISRAFTPRPSNCCAPTLLSAHATSLPRRRPKAPETSSNRCRANSRCRP